MKALMLGGKHGGVWLNVHPGCSEVRFAVLEPHFEVIRKDLFAPEFPRMEIYERCDLAAGLMSDAVVFRFKTEI